MVARRYLLRLHRYARELREWETNLDPSDDGRLRELLEEGVRQVRGTLRLDLADGWKLTVLAPGGGRRFAQVSVDSSGRTVVKR